MEYEHQEANSRQKPTSTQNATGREALVNVSRACLVVAGKGFAMGGILHAGLGIISGVTTLKLFKQPSGYLWSLLSGDLVRFASFVAASGAAYTAVTEALMILQQQRGEDKGVWWIPVSGGLAAGLTSFIDEPNRRRTILLYLMARALGTTVHLLHKDGHLPTVPHFTTGIFSLCCGIVVLCVTHHPHLLPPSYYRAALRWSYYYDDDKLNQLFRSPSDQFIQCNPLLHDGSCHQAALVDLYRSALFFTKIYFLIYSLPLLLWKLQSLVRDPVTVIRYFVKNVAVSTLFFSTAATTVKYLVCLLRNWDHTHPPAPQYIPFVAGLVGSLAVLIERPSRQVELMYYGIPQVLYIAWRLLCIKKPLKLHKIPAGSVWLFCASLMVVMYAHERSKESLAPSINRTLNFLLEQKINY